MSIHQLALRALVTIAIGSGVLLAAPAAQAEERLVERHPPSSASWGVAIAGGAMFAGGYGVAAVMGAGWSDVPGGEMNYIPVAGPFIALGQSGCAASEESSPGEGDCGGIMALRGILFVLDGLLQVGSLVVIGEGIFMTTEADPVASPKITLLPGLDVTPVSADLAAQPIGLTLGGQF